MNVMLGLVALGLLALALESSVIKLEDLRIPTTSGILHGKSSTTLQKPLKLFLGVPYAQPPIGSLRFKPPVKLAVDGIEKYATQFAPSCKQPEHRTSVISPLLEPNKAQLSEDCLYLNIYVPSHEQIESPLPVMIWLPGEGFDYADPQQFDGSYLAVQGNVIVVTVNYRLSVFGFLSVLSDEAPGNVGLLDQRMALKWVKENIASFGGNPEEVTLFGRFTGSMSAAIHAFSPLSKEEQLFQRIILQSGVPVDDWVFDRNPLNTTVSLAESLNCKLSTLSEMIECLRKQPADNLLNASLSRRFRPVYDSHLITDSTFNLAKKSDYAPVDVMIGYTADEGSLCVIALKAMQSPFYEKLVDNTLNESDFRELVQMHLSDFYKQDEAFIAKLTTYKYQSFDESLRNGYVKFCGDLHLKSPALKLADELADKNLKVYAYNFAHRPSFSIHPDFIGAAHGDDVLFFLGLSLKMIELPTDEGQLTRQIMETVSNFAKSGNPNPFDSQEFWPQYEKESRQTMVFDTNQIEGETSKAQRDPVVFWHDIISAARHSCK